MPAKNRPWMSGLLQHHSNRLSLASIPSAAAEGAINHDRQQRTDIFSLINSRCGILSLKAGNRNRPLPALPGIVFHCVWSWSTGVMQIAVAKRSITWKALLMAALITGGLARISAAVSAPWAAVATFARALRVSPSVAGQTPRIFAETGEQ